MDELMASLNDAIESCKAAITAVDPLIASLNGALESCEFALSTAMVTEYNAVQQLEIVGSNFALVSAMENLRRTYEPIATLIDAIGSCEATFAALEAKFNAALQVAAVDPDLAMAIANLHHTYEHFQLVRNNMNHFMIITGMLSALHEEHDTTEPAPVKPVVVDMSEDAPEETAESNTGAPDQETVVHTTAASEETAEYNRDLPDFDPIMRHLIPMIARQLMALNPTAADEPVASEETVETGETQPRSA